MKKLLIIAVLFALSISSYAQNKGVTPEQKAKDYTEYISDKMDLSKKETKFLNKTFVAKYTDVSSKVKGKDLSKEEKKVIYKASYEWTKTELAKKFSEKEIKEIFALVKEYNKKSKK